MFSVKFRLLKDNMQVKQDNPIPSDCSILFEAPALASTPLGGTRKIPCEAKCAGSVED